MHAGQAQGGTGVQVLEPGMGMGGTQHGGLQGAGLGAQVVGVGAAAGEQGMVFQPGQALAHKGRGTRGLGRGCLQSGLLVPTTGTRVLCERVSANPAESTNGKVWP